MEVVVEGFYSPVNIDELLGIERRGGGLDGSVEGASGGEFAPSKGMLCRYQIPNTDKMASEALKGNLSLWS